MPTVAKQVVSAIDKLNTEGNEEKAGTLQKTLNCNAKKAYEQVKRQKDDSASGEGQQPSPPVPSWDSGEVEKKIRNLIEKFLTGREQKQYRSVAAILRSIADSLDQKITQSTE
jgi:hypothetical protein